MTKKNLLFLALLAMAAMVFSGCSNDDDDRFTVCPPGEGWGGKWQFVEMLDGPRGAKQPAAHTMEFTVDGKVLFTSKGKFPFDEATVNMPMDGWEYYFPDEQDKYGSPFPVFVIYHPMLNKPGFTFGLECYGNTLKLHYIDFYTTDHIPETYVYRRVK